MHTRTHTHTHARARTHTHACTHTHIHTHKHTHTDTHTHTHTHAHTHTHTHTHIHTHAHTHTHTRSLTQTYTRARARAHTHTHARTHAPPPTHTHTNTHTQMNARSTFCLSCGFPGLSRRSRDSSRRRGAWEELMQVAASCWLVGSGDDVGVCDAPPGSLGTLGCRWCQSSALSHQRMITCWEETPKRRHWSRREDQFACDSLTAFQRMITLHSLPNSIPFRRAETPDPRNTISVDALCFPLVRLLL